MDGKTILYSAADEPNPDVWGRCVEAVAFDDDDVPGKLSEGWARHPQDVPEDARKAAPKAVAKAEPKKAAEQ